MSNFVFILPIEPILVLSILLIVLLVFTWRKKKKNAAEIERLLSQAEESEATRKEHLVNYLTGQLSMEQQSAVEQVEDFIAAEKRFTHQFLEIQLNQQPVSDFYQNSCEFVDKYLQLIAENAPKPINDNLEITDEDSQDEQVDTNQSDEIEEESKESEVQDIEPESIDSNSEESDGSEVKDIEPKNVEEEASENLESNEPDQTPSSEPETTGETNNLEAEEDEFGGEEPDWGDAFAEAGVEMDENSGKE